MQQLTVQLPDSIKCIGGRDGNRCPAPFITTAGNRKCVVFTQTGNNTKRSASRDKGKPTPVDPTT